MARKVDGPKNRSEPENADTIQPPANEAPATPAVVANVDVTPLPVEPPKPRRKRRTRDEIAAARAAESEALAAEYRGQAAMICDMADALLGQTLPPPLDPSERAVLEPALARYMQAEQAAISPGWALVGALVVILAPRVVAAYQRYRRDQLRVLDGGADGANHPDTGPARDGQDEPGAPSN